MASTSFKLARILRDRMGAARTRPTALENATFDVTLMQ